MQKGALTKEPAELERQLKEIRSKIAALEKEQQFFENGEKIQALTLKMQRTEDALREAECALKEAEKEKAYNSQPHESEASEDPGHEFTVQQVEEYREAFSLFDKDGDGLSVKWKRRKP